MECPHHQRAVSMGQLLGPSVAKYAVRQEARDRKKDAQCSEAAMHKGL